MAVAPHGQSGSPARRWGRRRYLFAFPGRTEDRISSRCLADRLSLYRSVAARTTGSGGDPVLGRVIRFIGDLATGSADELESALADVVMVQQIGAAGVGGGGGARKAKLGSNGESAMISTQRLNRAAWLSITIAALSIPILALSVIIGAAAAFGGFSAFQARTAIALLTVGSAALFVYVFSTFRMLMEDKYGFRDTSDLIRILIVINVVIAVLSVASIPSAKVESTVGWLTLIAIIPLGIIYIVFGIKLLRLPQDLHRMLKPFSYTAIATGFCYATILLIPAGMLVGAVNAIILAIIFFRASDGMAA